MAQKPHFAPKSENA